MTDPDNRTSGLDPLIGESLAWIVHLASGMATEADARALERWRRQSPAHEAAWREAVGLHRTIGASARELAAPATATVVSLPVRRPIGRRLFLGGALAASAAGVAIVRPPWSLWPSLVEMTADYRTATGERRRVELAAGISLELNTQTSIAVRSLEGEARIELIAGEAEVDARASRGMPVVVVAQGGRVMAAEAGFNIRRDEAEVCVTCLRGTVEVARADSTARLEAGQQLIYTAAGLGAPQRVDPAVATAWRAGLLIFQDKPLSQVIEEVNRYRPGRIILANEALGRRPVNGVFHLDRLDGVIAQLRSLGARVTSLPGGIVLLS